MPVRNVGDAINEWKAGTSKHFRSRAQAIAIGLKAEGKSKYQRGGKRRGRKMSKGRSLGGSR